MRGFRPHGPRLALGAALAASGALGLVDRAANRLVSGRPVAFPDAVSGFTLGALIGLTLLLGVSALFGRCRLAHGLAVLLSAALAVLLCAAAGEAAWTLQAGAPAASRVMLGAGFWSGFLLAGLICVEALQSLRAGVLARGVAGVLVAGGILVLAGLGRFDALSLAREYAAHRGEFVQALLRHVLLVGSSLALTLAAGVPLGLAVQRRAGWRRPVFAALNIMQTIPSVAVFGLLMAPLTAFGLSGIGLAPALAALPLYGLLPVVRGVVTGLDGVPAECLEAASGLGLSPVQRLLRVEIPLALPAFWAGLRLVTVQSVGLAVVASLIGAGGFGDFVFQGLGQYAVDLVLLGALPTIVMALLADFLLGIAARPPGWRGR